MATVAAAKKPKWEDYALLESSKTPGLKYLVQKYLVQKNDQDGTMRCHCKSYIFSGKGGAVRNCKHIDLAKKQVDPIWQMADVMTQDITKLLKAWGSAAYGLPPAIVSQIEIAVHKHLVGFVPPAGQVMSFPVSQGAGSGVRKITFDD
jgi:hypothetical protein